MVERGPTTLSSLLIQKAARKGTSILIASMLVPLDPITTDFSLSLFIKDSGVYVCSPSSAPAAQASIHILEGISIGHHSFYIVLALK